MSISNRGDSTRSQRNIKAYLLASLDPNSNSRYQCNISKSQVTELRKPVLVNKAILIALRTNFDKLDIMKELFKRLQNVNSMLQRLTIMTPTF